MKFFYNILYTAESDITKHKDFYSYFIQQCHMNAQPQLHTKPTDIHVIFSPTPKVHTHAGGKPHSFIHVLAYVEDLEKTSRVVNTVYKGLKFFTSHGRVYDWELSVVECKSSAEVKAMVDALRIPGLALMEQEFFVGIRKAWEAAQGQGA
ncbi:hypothetical protein BDQ17DRAFT_1367720 [Cyathus striatus]|nr:hypothetical protein BDQ17DRAFT_1367720 [Cyathus striatus]